MGILTILKASGQKNLLLGAGLDKKYLQNLKDKYII